MTIKTSTASANAAAGSTGFKEQLDLGFLYLFAGPPPASADAALDMATQHTEVLKVSISSGATGLTFATPAGGVLSKTVAEVWSGVVTLDGFDDAGPTCTPTFYRFCAAGDNGRGAANTSTGYRVQGSVGGPGSGADLQLGVAALTAGATQPVGAFGWRVGEA